MLCGVVAPQVSDAKYDSWYARAKDALLSAFVVRCAEFARRPGPPREESVVRDDEQKEIWQAWLARLHHLRPDGDLVGELKALAAKVARQWPTQEMRAASVSPYKGSTFAHDKGTRRRAAAAASSNVERVLSHQEQAKRRRAINMPREPGSSKFACTRGTAAAGMLRGLGGGDLERAGIAFATAQRARNLSQQANAAAMAVVRRAESGLRGAADVAGLRRSPRRAGGAAAAARGAEDDPAAAVRVSQGVEVVDIVSP
jgi:hypothetical protein